MLAFVACGDGSTFDTPHPGDGDTSSDAGDAGGHGDGGDLDGGGLDDGGLDDGGLDNGGGPNDEVGADADASGDDGDDETLGPQPEWCEGTTEHRYDPFVADELLFFPDDAFTIEDPSSPTGLRVHLSAETSPLIAEIPELLQSITIDMNVLSGFGSNAGIVIRFSASVAAGLPLDERASLEGEGLMLVDLSVDPPTRVPFETISGDEGLDVILWPLRPLTLGARHALVITRALSADDGGCIAPSAFTRSLLHGEPLDERHGRLAARVRAAVGAMGLEVDDVTAAVTFTVHDDLQAVIGAAASLRGRSYDWDGVPECETLELFRHCEARFLADDFREGRYVQTSEAVTRYSLPVSVWLPLDAEPPYPVVMYGHGMNNERTQGAEIAEHLAPLGIAVVATDAIGHGLHPTRSSDTSSIAALDFLGLSLSPIAADPLALRGNFDQTVLDRLQVFELLRQAPDIDGDGTPDFDPDVVGYWGISMGGMLGPGLLALNEEIGAAILSVAGGRLLSFATDTAQVAAFRPLLEHIIGSDELFNRLIPVAQALVDPADPATFGALLLRNRPLGDAPPSILMPVALEDDTVPPATGRALARAIGLPQAGEAFYALEVVERVETPVQGNVDGGVTAAYFQFDRVTRGSTVVAATHSNVPLGTEGLLQAMHFIDTWLDGRPEIVDPYVELGTPRLE